MTASSALDGERRDQRRGRHLWWSGRLQYWPGTMALTAAVVHPVGGGGGERKRCDRLEGVSPGGYGYLSDRCRPWRHRRHAVKLRVATNMWLLVEGGHHTVYMATVPSRPLTCSPR